MKATRILCLAALLACAYFGVRILVHEETSRAFRAEPVRDQLSQIEDRTQLNARVDALLTALEKADQRIHHWRRLTIRAWFTAGFLFAMVLLASFVWHQKPTLDEQLDRLEREIGA